MKTTIDIPDALYRKAKIRAFETGQTLKHFVLASLSRELQEPVPSATLEVSCMDRRVLLPAFAQATRTGAFRPPAGARDITDLISEDRDAR